LREAKEMSNTDPAGSANETNGPGRDLASQIEASAEEAKDVEVLVSYEVVKLFSDQLYPSPLKAIEELVVNSWDAGANTCSVLCRLEGDRPVIAVFDDGKGMTLEELEDLWHIGVSLKPAISAGRKQIGKFGIGKLASNAVARRATYISKTAEGIYSVAIDFAAFADATTAAGIPSRVTLKIRHIATVADLLALDAFAGILDVLRGADQEGAEPESLVGNGLDVVPSWTMVVLEDLKPKASQLSTNRLRWVLQTAMPLASDFNLYLNKIRIDSSKASYTRAVEFEVYELEDERLRSLESVTSEKWTRNSKSITSPSFPSGISGSVYVTEKSLYSAGGKSEDLGRSHGFFVRVRNRLINETDPLFGARPLSFTTWYRFAAIVEVDDLNDYITAARDDVEDSTIKEKLREFLIALFNQARDLYEEKQKRAEENNNKDKKEDERDYVSPRLTEKPLADALVESQDDDDDSWEYLEPLDDSDSLKDFVDRLYTQPRAERKYTFRHASAGPFAPLVRMNAVTGTFMINDDHELVQEFGDKPETRRLLDLVAASEAFLEVYLRDAHIDEGTIIYILKQRDSLLRSLAVDEAYALPALAAQLRSSGTNATELEIAVVGALRALGFGASHIGGSGTPDGLASYVIHGVEGKSFTLEAKSSGRVPELSQLDFAGLKSHYEANNANGCMLVAPTYPGITDPGSEVSLRAIQQKVSCWTIDQLARVVEAAEQRQINVKHVEEIVFKSFMPLDVDAAVSALLADPVYSSRDLYRAILGSLRSLAPRLQNTPRHILLLAAEVSRDEAFIGIDTPAIRKAVEDLARASKGIMYITTDDNIYILGDLDELERRVSGLTESETPPRRRGSFRDGGVF
jgi:hypothetical protein